MAEALLPSQLTSRLSALAERHGLAITLSDAAALSGQVESIRSKWFLGGRKVVYRFRVHLDAASCAARFRESVTESTWGIPPPGLTVEKTTQSGARVSEARTDVSIGGGGTLDYGSLREAVDQAVRDAGWQFSFEAGRAP